jgi:hypothetical protein
VLSYAVAAIGSRNRYQQFDDAGATRTFLLGTLNWK